MKYSPIQLHRSRCNKGYTLIEVLIATLVIAVGTLGVAAGQLVSLHSNQSAYWRTQATILASGFIDRVRSNPQAYRHSSAYAAFAIPQTGPSPDANCHFSLLGCSSQQLASSDIAQWSELFAPSSTAGTVAEIAPGARAEVTHDKVTGVLKVQVFWREHGWRKHGTDANHEVLLEQSVSLNTVLR